VHGPTGAAEVELPCAEPLEVARHFPVEGRADKRRGRLGDRPRWLGRDVRHEELFRCGLVEGAVDVPQVAPEQVVELVVVLG
jgi:hypothetical protein